MIKLTYMLTITCSGFDIQVIRNIHTHFFKFPGFIIENKSRTYCFADTQGQFRPRLCVLYRIRLGMALIYYHCSVSQATPVLLKRFST